MNIKNVTRAAAALFCCVFTLVCESYGCFASAESPSATEEANIFAEQTESEKAGSYFEYYEKYSSENRPQKEIILSAADAKAESSDALKETEGTLSVVFDDGNSWAEWSFTVEESGVYSIYPEYYTLEATGKDIVVSVQIDGTEPYTECGSFSLNRLWADALFEDGSKTATDSSGDDLRPEQVEVHRWYERAFSDSVGLYSEPYLLYLEKGSHSLRLTLESEAMAVSKIKIANKKEAVSYSEYHSEFTRDDLADVDEVIYLQAENAYEKTSRILYPVYDRSSAATMPNDPSHIRLNTIGQNNWNSVGQAISWEVNVPEAGLYKIAFRAKQNYNSGMNSYRTLYINGELPFSEAQNIVFPYKRSWQIVTLGGENTYYVWLEPGDILTLECTSGKMNDVLCNLQQTVLSLNELYRKIIVITGSSPDIYRDYHLEDQIPGLSDEFNSIHSELEKIIDRMNLLNGGTSPLSATVKMMSDMASELAGDTYFIPERLSSLKSNIESLGSLINTLGEQPLELDYICFVPSGVELPEASAGIFSSISFEFKKFIASFAGEYEGDYGSNSKVIEVWAATGRDQAHIMKNMVEDSFTSETNVGVKISLVDTGGNLIKATLAGKGPDVAIMIAEDAPVNLAMRDMLVDLTDYVDENFLSAFRQSALTPFYYNGGLYALPETETFDMLFYRDDILDELELEVPETWDEFYSAIKILQSNNLNVGIPEVNSGNMGISSGIGTFCKFLFQNGGTYYNEDLTSTLFDTATAQKAFTEWVELYSRYGLDRSFDFFNTFRSGEMPLGIVSFTTYNQLSEAAPEIRGLWNFAPVPGTVREDGVIDRSQSSSVTGCIVISAAEDHGVCEEAVEFVKWWTGEEIQARFGRELEAILGVSARYATANLNAAEQLGWSPDEWEILSEQGEWIKNVPQIPGNYMVNRALTNAFRAALNGTNSPARSLTIYNKDICQEITRKRKEFGLS